MSPGTLQIKLDELELGRLYYRACDFDLAIRSLEQALPRLEAEESKA